MNKLKSFNSSGAEKRIQHLFQRLKNASTEVAGSDIDVEFTRKEIAEMTGLRTETVIHTIRKMADHGQLRMVRHKIILKK